MSEDIPKIEKKKWFKFYGSDFLLDPKMMELNSVEKVMWITLLCLASSSGENGFVRRINNVRLASFAGIIPLDDDYALIDGVLEHFEELSMITIEKLSEKRWDIHLTNFIKRQESNLTPYERVKRHREKAKSNSSNDKKLSMITADKIRLDKIKLYNSKKYLSSNEAKEYLYQKFPNLTHKRIDCELENMSDWLETKGTTKKNYQAFARIWLRKIEDTGPKKDPNHVPYIPPKTSTFSSIGDIIKGG